MTTATGRRPISWGRVAIPGVILLEIIVAVAVSKFIGIGWTLFALAALSLLGGWVLLREGRRAWTSLAVPATDPGATTRAGADAPRTATGMAAGLLLAVPGFLTALAGGFLLLPPVRRLAGGRLDAFMARRGQGAGQGNVVVGEIVVSDVPPATRVSDMEEPGPLGGPGSRPESQ